MATAELMKSCPPDKDMIEELRNKTLPELMKTPDLYYESDIQRFKTDDLYAHKFMAHQFFLNRKCKNLVEKGSEMVLNEFKWRKEFGVKNIKREEIPDEFFERKGCISLKEDKDGRAVVIIRVKCLRKSKSGEKKLLQRFLTYWLENIYQNNSYGVTIIIDCLDAGLSNVNLDFTDFAHFIFRYHYPCFLGYFLVYNMPKIFTVIWELIKKVLPVGGVDRIKFVDETSILEYIDKSHIPSYMGGDDTSELKYDYNLLDTDELHAQKKEKALQQSMRSLSLVTS